MTHSDILSAELTSWIENTRKAWHLPAVSVSVVARDDSEDAFQSQVFTCGVRDGQGRPAENDSIFLIASTSKLFVSTAIGILIADKVKLSNGKILEWSTKLKDILPDWKLQDEYASDHTDLIDLLSMRIGLPGHDRLLGNQSSAEVIRQLRHLRLSGEFRQVRQYSNVGYTIGAEIVRVITGMSYEDFIRKRVFEPLGMSQSTFSYEVASQHDKQINSFIQVGIRESEGRKAWQKYKETGSLEGCVGKSVCYDWKGSSNPEISAGAGGIWSTVGDMEQIKPSLIPQDVRQAIYTPQFFAFSPAHEATGHYLYGLGTYVLTYRGHIAYYHAGGCPGQYCYQVVLPGKGKAVFVHSNDDEHSPNMNKIIAFTVLDFLLGMPLHSGDWLNTVMDMSNSATEPKTPEKTEPGVAPNIEGKYTHAVYPSFDIHRLGKDDDLHDQLDIIQSRSEEDLHLDTREIFYCRAESIFVVEILFVHEQGSIFTWLATKGYRVKDSSEIVFRSIDGSGKCSFEQGGLGMGGDWWLSGGQRSVEVKAGMDPEDFEVWFTKDA